MLKRILFIVSIVFSASFLFGEDNKFSFIQITDSHLGFSDNNLKTGNVIDNINKLPVDISFIAHTGDVLDFRAIDNNIDENLSVFKKSKYKIYFIPGNNEINTKNFSEKYKTFEQKVSKINYSEIVNNVLLIFFYTSPFIKVKKYDQLEEFQWLDKTLKTSGNKPVILFMHIPNTTNFYSNKMHETEWLKENSDYFTDLVNKYNVKAIITGHFHSDELHYVGRVPLFVSPAIAKMEAGLSYYRIFDYNNGTLSYRTIMVK
jgi:UDP-2,3-diacylglucosamine pyrophosphatase LpxH